MSKDLYFRASGPVHKMATVIDGSGANHPRNYGSGDLRPQDVGLSLFLNLAQCREGLTDPQRRQALEVLEAMYQDARQTLGAEPDGLQRSDVVKVFRGDEVYYGLVLRSTDDLVRLECLQPDGTTARRSLHYENGWELEEFPGLRGRQDLILAYVADHLDDISDTFLVNAIGQDRELAERLYRTYCDNFEGQTLVLSVLLILGDQQLMVDYVVETNDRDYGCIVLSHLRGDHLIKALVHASPRVVETARVLQDLSDEQIARAILDSENAGRSRNTAIFRRLQNGGHEEDEE